MPFAAIHRPQVQTEARSNDRCVVRGKDDNSMRQEHKTSNLGYSTYRINKRLDNSHSNLSLEDTIDLLLVLSWFMI